jgi:hypothetical protein
MQPKQRILVVADRTAEAPELTETLSRRAAARPAGFTLLVPATTDGLAWANTDGLAWANNAGAAWSRAISRAELAAARIRGAGLELEETIVGDPDPALAIDDALHARRFDDVIVVRPRWERDSAGAPQPARAAA